MNDWGSFHDTVWNATNKQLSDTELKQLFATLPQGDRLSARHHGLSDSCFGDDAYTYLKENSDVPEADFSLNGEILKDEGECTLTLKFDSITDMILFKQMMSDCDDCEKRLALGDGDREFVVEP